MQVLLSPSAVAAAPALRCSIFAEPAGVLRFASPTFAKGNDFFGNFTRFIDDHEGIARRQHHHRNGWIFFALGGFNEIGVEKHFVAVLALQRDHLGQRHFRTLCSE